MKLSDNLVVPLTRQTGDVADLELASIGHLHDVYLGVCIAIENRHARGESFEPRPVAGLYCRSGELLGVEKSFLHESIITLVQNSPLGQVAMHLRPQMRLKNRVAASLSREAGMTIVLPENIASELLETASALGVSVDKYVEDLLAETRLRRTRVAEFQSAIAERMADLNSRGGEDGEAVMARLIEDLLLR